MMTALSFIASCCSTRLSSVVLPLPRKPVISETGSRSADLSPSNRLIGILPVLFLSLDNSLPEVEHIGKCFLSPDAPGRNWEDAMHNEIKSDDQDGGMETDRRSLLRTAGLAGA